MGPDAMDDAKAKKPHTDKLGFSPQAHRILIGLLGLLLPVLVCAAAWLVPTAGLPVDSPQLDSISSYYYTSGVGFFVGINFAIALFFLTYQGYPGEWEDRIAGAVAGLSAALMVCFPTAPPGDPFRAAWWFPWMGTAHLVAAGTLFVTLIFFSVVLFRRSHTKERADRDLDKRRRDDVCLACGIVMAGAVVWAGIAGRAGRPIFWQEATAIGAFAVSWLTKGSVHRWVPARVRELSGRPPGPSE